MFFGLTNSPATFQTMMDVIFEDMISEGKTIVSLDDILIFNQTLEEHREMVKRAVKILHKHNLFLKPEKCEFERTEVEYLRVIISHNSARMDPVKVSGVADWPSRPTKKKCNPFSDSLTFTDNL